MGSTGDVYCSFGLAEDAVVHVAHDERIKDKPKWLGEFAETELLLESHDTVYRVFSRSFPAGQVQLGGNTTDGVPAGRSQYVVIITPAPLKTQTQEATVAAVLTALPTASEHRGARLFF